MSNLLTAIRNILECRQLVLPESGVLRRNRIQEVGSALETYIKDAFSGHLAVRDQSSDAARKLAYSQTFSWNGNANNPPDLILRGGDAVEVKKIENLNNTIALNSSYPKARLEASNPMILAACRDCEVWDVKDIIYAVGAVARGSLRSLWFVYGDCYAASPEVYTRIADSVRHIISDSELELSETTELARVNRVDPLGITSLRVRGMWQIQNPYSVFAEVCPASNNCSFALNAIMRNEKYLSFPEASREALENMEDKGLQIRDCMSSKEMGQKGWVR